MKLTTPAAILALSRSTDTYLVTTLAEYLGDEVFGTAPVVALPGEWCRQRQSATAKAAAWAARYCGDEDVLFDILRQTKRSTVREGICNSPYLTHMVRERMVAWADECEFSDLAGELATSKAQTPLEAFETALEDERSFAEDTTALLRAMTAYLKSGDSAGYAKVCARGLELRSAFVISAIIRGRYVRTTTFDETHVLLARAWLTLPGRPTITEMYNMLSEIEKKILLTGLRNGVMGEVPLRPVGKFFATEMVRLLDPPRYSASGRRWRRRIFTAAALDVFISNPAWLAIVAMHEISDERFYRALDRAGKYARDLVGATRTREHVAALTTVLESQHRYGTLSLLVVEAKSLCELCTGGDDPLVERLYRMGDIVTREQYLLGNWSEDRKKVLPKAALLLEEIRAGRGEIISFENVMNSYPHRVDHAYVEVCLEYLPGAATEGLKWPVCADYVWGLLNSCSSNTLMALSIYSEHPEKALVDICSMARLLEKTPALAR
jgi:hypothetical protein